MTKRFKSARRVESRGHFVSKAFVLNEAVLASRLNSLLVQAHRVEVPALKTRNLGRHERVLVSEGRSIALGPLAQLFLVRYQEISPRFLLLDRGILVERRVRQCGVVEVDERLDLTGGGPKQRLPLVGCREGLSVVPGQE